MSHTSELELKQKIKQVDIDAGDVYHHYKDSTKLYKVLHVALDEATEHVMVVYQALYGEGLVWVRNLESFQSDVKYNGETIKRFVAVSRPKWSQTVFH